MTTYDLAEIPNEIKRLHAEAETYGVVGKF